MTFRQALRSSALYPITLLYAAMVLMMLAVVNDKVSAIMAIAALALFSVVAVLHATWAEMRVVQGVVSAQQTDVLALLDRIDVLTVRLRDADVEVPPADTGEMDLRSRTGSG